jgi:hypothetical protein
MSIGISFPVVIVDTCEKIKIRIMRREVKRAPYTLISAGGERKNIKTEIIICVI